MDEDLTLEEMQSRKLELIDGIQSIEIQLSDKDKRDPETGERLDHKHYHEWRRGAIVARSYKVKEVRALNARINKLIDNETRTQLHRIESKLDLIIQYMEEEVEE